VLEEEEEVAVAAAEDAVAAVTVEEVEDVVADAMAASPKTRTALSIITATTIPMAMAPPTTMVATRMVLAITTETVATPQIRAAKTAFAAVDVADEAATTTIIIITEEEDAAPNLLPKATLRLPMDSSSSRQNLRLRLLDSETRIRPFLRR
jgi:hypothetical protein